MKFTKISALVAATTMLLLSAMPSMAMQDWIIKQSPYDVKTTSERLVAVIKKAGATLFAVIDHQEGAKKAGLEMNAATVVLFGNPKIGTPIMNANPRAALDLPIKVLIWNEDGKTMIGALSPAALKTRYAIEGAEKPFKMMNGALNKLIGVAIAK